MANLLRECLAPNTSQVDIDPRYSPCLDISSLQQKPEARSQKIEVRSQLIKDNNHQDTISYFSNPKDEEEVQDVLCVSILSKAQTQSDN